MANGSEERRADTVEVSRSKATFLTTVGASLLVAITTLFYQRGTTIAALEEKYEALKDDISELKEFGPITGRRFTWDDSEKLRDEDRAIRQELRQAVTNCLAHQNEGAHPDADRRINANTFRIQRLEENEHLENHR